MSDKKQIVVKSGSSIGLGSLLFLLFLGLRLTGYIDWSWWWVTAPLWIPFAFVTVVLVFVSCMFAVAALLSR